ncbi:docking protein 2-like [Sinocyclocheilus rhinocerous]|uniref:docking protein 2-like n=1 Tax=Sinocyclocheilus rhinocerous TaxID=307959 RepID=UPI0007B81BE8|nr:PREDICTED: docking protein 2-like [Sinocyclocheilus rhinocerous]XP_016375533.1 PREDICTED: docking protein 2-like [Sinocyclocheilus rhinocerous]
MDTHGKQGEVYLQHQKHGEKWKRYWLALHPASRHGVARLELSEAVHERSTVVVRRHPERKVVRLADCVSVVKLPPHAEACPGENMAAFCVEMEDRRLVFAAEKESCGEWVDIICNNAFQKHTKSVPHPVPLMEDNQIYMSREQLCDFKVVVLQNEASVRCGLKGQYWLQAGEDMLVLQDLETRRTVMEWPYKLLRRYGRDKMLFSIEAGRRSESGPGTFDFETRQSDEILRLTESAIRLQKSLAVTGDRHSPHSPRSRSPRSPLPRRPDSFTLLDTEGSNSPQPSDTKLPLNPNPADVLGPNIYAVHTKPASPIGLTEPAYANPADSICSLKSTHSDPGGGISLIEPVYSNPAILIGRHEPVYADIKTDPLPSHHWDESEPVYSDPADVIRPKLNNCVYANPTDTMDCRPVKTTPNNDKQQEPVYSEVYDHVKLNTSKRLDQTEEPIYSVPEFVQSTKNDSSQQNKMPDENQSIYNKVYKPPKTPHPLQEKKLSQTPEVVSEDLGMI